MFWVLLNIRWLTVKVNLVLALKAVKKIARLRNQSSLNLRELRKEILRITSWYLWIKQEKRKVYSWPESKSLQLQIFWLREKVYFCHAPSFVKKSVFKESFQAAGKILSNKRNNCLIKIIQDGKQRKDLKVGEHWIIEMKCLKLSPM